MHRAPEVRDEASVYGEMTNSSVALPTALTIVGGSLASAGAALFVTGLLDETRRRDRPTLVLSGGLVGSVGAVLGGVGVVMFIIRADGRESRARVAQNRGAPAEPAQVPGGRVGPPRGRLLIVHQPSPRTLYAMLSRRNSA